MQPPYTITSKILLLVASVSEKVGEVKTAYLNLPPAELRRENRIKTIQSSLQIEGNTLSIEQVSALLDNKRVVATQKDIQEVRNAINTYNQLDTFKPYSITSLCQAHKLLMSGLIDNAGQIRTSNVGIAKGDEIAHVAPPSYLIKDQLNALFSYVKKHGDLLLIKSCVFHYEFEFIHPFLDGNGRMGRLWQTILLRQEYPVFEFLPIETLIKHKQQEYYTTLAQCDKLGESTLFIEFMLSIIDEALEALLISQPITISGEDRVRLFQPIIKDHSFSRKEYMRHFKNISTATASRDMREAKQKGILNKMGDGRNTTYKFNCLNKYF